MVPDQVAQLMTDRLLLRPRLEGPTDLGGAEKSKLVLSRRRAEVVAAYRARRVTRTRLNAAGSSRPLAVSRIAAGRAQNRRVGFQVVSEESPE